MIASSTTMQLARLARRSSLAFLMPLLGVFGCAADVKDGAPAATGGSGNTTDPEVQERCVSTRQFFLQQVWPKVMANKCINCHAPGGLASERLGRFVLYPTAYPGFVEENLSAIRDLAKTEYEDESVLLRKSRGELTHGGGMQVSPESDEAKLLADLVKRLQTEETCNAPSAPPSVSGVELLTPSETFRKASLILAGRVPRADELSVLDAEGEAALPAMLGGLLEEPGFRDWLLVTFNDLFLTDRYLGDSTNTLRREDFPNVEVYLAEGVPDEEKRKYRRSVAREPLEFIAYIVKNNRPFTEILTADYTVHNPYSAQIYNDTSLAFDDPTNEADFKPGKIHAMRQGVAVTYPHAGILSSPMFLNRFPTSPTNRNRHRAKVLFEKFLATDILKIGDRPLDPTKSVAFANATREDPSCSVCHSIIDPVAGAFMKFSDTDAEQLLPAREWYKEMFLPGFGQEAMQVTDYDRSLPWLAQRIASDPRFPLSVVLNVYTALTGQVPLPYPQSGEAGALASWERQDGTFRAIAAAFVSSDYNYKTAVREVLMSPYFRASNASVEAVGAHGGELDAYGTAKLSTPENLAKKLRAIVGFHWVRSDRQPALTTTYDILYGGIDSDTVAERLEEPNGVMSAVMSRMANEVSCQAVAWEFTKPAEQRVLFPQVTVADTPTSAEPAIRAAIKHLHAHVLGESLPDGHPDLERTYALFRDTWEEGSKKVVAKELNAALPYSCRGRWDRTTGTELPEAQRLEQDKEYTIRAWMAVVTYLLSDYRFLYE